jgi:hypothetical protein
MSSRVFLAALALSLSLPTLAAPPGPRGPMAGGQRPAGTRPVRNPGVAQGMPAPDFALVDIDTGASVQLSALTAEQPVALIFGSFT